MTVLVLGKSGYQRLTFDDFLQVEVIGFCRNIQQGFSMDRFSHYIINESEKTKKMFFQM